MSPDPDIRRAKRRLSELDLEHALSDDELRLVLEDPPVFFEHARQQAAAAAVISTEIFAYYTAEMFGLLP